MQYLVIEESFEWKRDFDCSAVSHKVKVASDSHLGAGDTIQVIVNGSVNEW